MCTTTTGGFPRELGIDQRKGRLFPDGVGCAAARQVLISGESGAYPKNRRFFVGGRIRRNAKAVSSRALCANDPTRRFLAASGNNRQDRRCFSGGQARMGTKGGFQLVVGRARARKGVSPGGRTSTNKTGGFSQAIRRVPAGQTAFRWT